MEEYLGLIRVVMLLFRTARRSSSVSDTTQWPTHPAKLANIIALPGGLGCPSVEMVYVYTYAGSIYSNLEAIPFWSERSAKDYAVKFTADCDLVVRLKPGNPEKAVFLEDDQWNVRHLHL